MTDEGATSRKVPVAANTGAILAVGLDLQDGKVIPRKQVRAWALWDWATQPFNSVLLTFVFVPLYLINYWFLPADVAALKPEDGATVVDPAYTAGIADLSGQFSLAVALAGIAIALLAPVLGQQGGCIRPPQALARDLDGPSRALDARPVLRAGAAVVLHPRHQPHGRR